MPILWIHFFSQKMANFFKKKGGGQVATSGIQMTDV